MVHGAINYALRRVHGSPELNVVQGARSWVLCIMFTFWEVSLMENSTSVIQQIFGIGCGDTIMGKWYRRNREDPLNWFFMKGIRVWKMRNAGSDISRLRRVNLHWAWCFEIRWNNKTKEIQGYSLDINLVDSRVLRNKRLQTPSGPEGSSGSSPLCVPQGCLAINKLFLK